MTDNLGSLLAVFNNVTSNAVLLSTQLYGSSRYAAGPQLSTYTGKGYTGQYSDAVSGLDYYNARYYDPVSGVFLSADSTQGNDQGLNPYAYAGNNPTTLNDPSGQGYAECLQPQCGGQGATDTLAPPASDTGSSDTPSSSGGDGGNWLPTVIKIVIIVATGVLLGHEVATTPWDGTQGTATTPPIPALAGVPLTSLVYHDQPSPPSPYDNPIFHDTPITGPPQTQTGGGSGRPPKPPTKPTAPSPREPPGRPNIRRMNPQDVRFTQNTCTNEGDGYTVLGNIQALSEGNLSPEDLPTIRVFQKLKSMNWGEMTKNGFTGNTANLEDGQWYTLDNRRLYAFQQAGITDVSVQDVTDQVSLIRRQTWKFTTENYGTDIELLC